MHQQRPTSTPSPRTIPQPPSKRNQPSSSAHGGTLTLKWLPESYGFAIVKSDLVEPADARAQEELDALAWIVSYVAEQHAETGAGVPRGKVENAYHEAHDNHGGKLARKVIDREIALAADRLAGATPGETFPALATGPGETQHGVYLFPFSDAVSPRAATPSGESGDTPTATLSLDPSRLSPPPTEKAASGETGGEGTKASEGNRSPTRDFPPSEDQEPHEVEEPDPVSVALRAPEWEDDEKENILELDRALVACAITERHPPGGLPGLRVERFAWCARASETTT